MDSALSNLSLDLITLRDKYLAGALNPETVVSLALDRIEKSTRSGVWISTAERDTVLAEAMALRARDPRTLPLYGIPFAVKDNIDVAGFPTTAACPAFAYTPQNSAPAVQRLIDAGAICLGKTNMDQFAAGLVGTRSPYGACQNAFNPEYISGGSSSGSAVAVALGQVAFSLGTDTAGSGRVPAAFNNLVGYKPTRGIISTRGVVPACRSLDCVSVFSLTVADGKTVVGIATGFDAESFGSRIAPKVPQSATRLRIGTPTRAHLQFGDTQSESLFDAAAERLAQLGAEMIEIDYTPFKDAAELLYGGPWIAERYAALKNFVGEQADEMFPVTRQIIERGRNVNGVDVFAGMYRLDALRTRAAEQWSKMDVMLLPTATNNYRIDEVNSNPIELNTRLGIFTNFVNLLDCCALALPAGFRSEGVPFGISLIAPAFNDTLLFNLGAEYHRALGGKMGATTMDVSKGISLAQPTPLSGHVRLAVVGAHLTGQPLNKELTQLNARLVETCRTAPVYKFYALATTPPKPGLIQVPEGQGTPIEVEVWELSMEAFGRFVANVPPPLAIGTLKLESGTLVKGFLCEPLATQGALDISEYAGWRNYLARR